MAVSSSSSFGVVAVAVLIFAIALPAVQAQSAPTSDGTSIDQGVAYVLMFLALALTYLIHSADLSC